MNKWIFIIDTDSYAGNFERDMCAYVTGIIGDCQVGEEFADLYNKEVNAGGGEESVFIDYVEQRPDEHGCCRPTYCWPTKGWLSVGHDRAVRKEDWNQEEANKAWQKEQAKIYQGYYDMYAKYDPKDPSVIKAGWTEESLKKQLDRCQKDIDKAKKEKSPKWEPNNSVAIFFEKKPSPEMISLMKQRANGFAQAKRDVAERENISWEKNFKLKIHGFRLVKETTNSEEEEI